MLLGEFNFRFEKILVDLESHVDERIASGSYNALKSHLVPFIQKLLGAQDFPERLILTAAAILDNNCFEISLPMRSVEFGGLFLLSLILCNDCRPNTKHYVNRIESEVDIQRYQMIFQTTGERGMPLSAKPEPNSISIPVPVKRGEHLTTTYTDTLKTTLERRRHLSQTKIFDCDCERCQDASECSTYGSSWLCGQCGGLIVSKNPQDNESGWECEKCKSQHSQEVSDDRRCWKFNLFLHDKLWSFLECERESFALQPLVTLQTRLLMTSFMLQPNLTSFCSLYIFRKSPQSLLVCRPN